MGHKDLVAETVAQENYKGNPEKDIIIVVKDCPELVEICIDSIYKFTENFNLYIWDNGSEHDTRKYLHKVAQNENVHVFQCPTNEGFIKPNNRLAQICKSPYIVLLNSDTRVCEDWDIALVAQLETDPSIVEVGYAGSLLTEDGLGTRPGFGYDIDYLCAWAICMPRNILAQFKLFDEIYEFAYFEDSDFSLRLKKTGYKIYGLHSGLVKHFGNATIKDLQNKGIHKKESFEKNKKTFTDRWKHYLEHERILK